MMAMADSVPSSIEDVGQPDPPSTAFNYCKEIKAEKAETASPRASKEDAHDPPECTKCELIGSPFRDQDTVMDYSTSSVYSNGAPEDCEACDGTETTKREIEEAVSQVVRVFSKPEPDRLRLHQAVVSAVSGKRTIKEASLKYGFATSTMHPYVHRARALLGARAPTMRSSRIAPLQCVADLKRLPKSHFKFPPRLESLKPRGLLQKKKKRKPKRKPISALAHLKSVSSTAKFLASVFNTRRYPFDKQTGGLIDDQLISENSANAAIEQSNGVTSDNGAHTCGSVSGDIKSEVAESSLTSEELLSSSLALEDVAREAIDSSSSSDEENMSLFLAVVRCLQGESSAEEAASTVGLPARLVSECVTRGRSMLGLPDAFNPASQLVAVQRMFLKKQWTAAVEESMSLFLAVVLCLQGESSAEEAVSTVGLPARLVSECLTGGTSMLGLPDEPMGSCDGHDSAPELLALLGGSSHLEPCGSVEEAVKRATRCSHYQGKNKERLDLAVLQTVIGELPLTQAAATHSVPFSTLHPYVKRAKLYLGMPLPQTSAGSSPGKLRSPLALDINTSHHDPLVSPTHTKSPRPRLVDRLSASQVLSDLSKSVITAKAHSSSSTGVKPRHRPPSNGAPRFGSKLREELPQFWRDHANLMRESVRRAVNTCQYDDPQKKERLCSAVVEALSGSKTMKAAAAMHDVPFTTLQTYFHRSKAQLHREAKDLKPIGITETSTSPKPQLSPNTSNPCEPRKSPVESDPNSPSMPSLISPASSLHSVGSSRGQSGHTTLTKRSSSNGAGGSVWSRLLERQEQLLRTFDQRELGDRKTDLVTPDLKKGDFECQKPLFELDIGLQDDDQPLNLSKSGPLSSIYPLTNGQKPAFVAMTSPKEGTKPVGLTGSSKRKPKKVVRQVQKTEPQKSEPNLKRLWDLNIKSEISDDSLNLDAISANDQEDVLKNCLVRPEKVNNTQRRNIVELKNRSGDRPKDVSLSPLSAVQRAIRNSQYDGDHRERLRDAVLSAVRGERSMKEAARQHNIPLGTFHTYYHRARNLLEAAESGLDPDCPAVVALINSLGAVTSSGGSRKHGKSRKHNVQLTTDSVDATVTSSVNESLSFADCEPATPEQVWECVAGVIRNSQYPPEQKRRLQEAVTSVANGDLTINAAANLYQLPSSTVHPYVHRTRAALGSSCPPQAKLTRVTSLTKPSTGSDSTSMSEAIEKSKASLINPRGMSPLVLPPKPKSNPKCTATMVVTSTVVPVPLEKLSTEDIPKCTAGSEEVKKEIVEEGRTEPKPETTEEGRTDSVDGETKSAVYSSILDVSLEDADGVVSELIRTSLYVDEGRQRLYEAVLMVVMESATCSEASRVYHIPPSTIQPYVHRARTALNLPQTPSTPSNSRSSTPKLNSVRKPVLPAPRVFAAPGNEATYAEVEEVVDKVVQNSVQADGRRERLRSAVLDATSGTTTIKATYVEAEEVVDKVAQNSVQADGRRECLRSAVLDATSGTTTTTIKATYAVVEEVVDKVVQNSIQADGRRKRLRPAVLDATSHQWNHYY